MNRTFEVLILTAKITIAITAILYCAALSAVVVEKLCGKWFGLLVLAIAAAISWQLSKPKKEL